MNLLLYPDRYLRSKSRSIETVTPDIKNLLSLMMDNMDKWGGIGLAAPQCGIGLRAFVTHIPGQGRHAFVNPILEDLREGVASMAEGCLSLPGAEIEISRPVSVKLIALSYNGLPIEMNCRGLMSVCVQHETDHLDGILILDRADAMNRRRAIQKIWDAEHPH
jgi:peptide deformylase